MPKLTSLVAAALLAAACSSAPVASVQHSPSPVTGGLAQGLIAYVADAGVGQTVVVRRGAVAAVEAIEGTTETIRRGLEVVGRGAVVAKAAARGHDYRFDMPTIGPETIEIAAAGGAAVVAVEAERVLVLDREACIRIANGAGMALVGAE